MKTDRMTRRDLLTTAVVATFAASAKAEGAPWPSPGRALRASPRLSRQVPDTLDLSNRARTALNGLAGTLDPAHNLYEIYFGVTYYANPPFMSHEATGLPDINPKYGESFPMMRVMTGSKEFVDIQEGMMRAMVSLIGSDGLFYAPALPWRTWNADRYPGSPDEDFANVYGNARLLLAFMAWMQYEPEKIWEEKAAGVARALSRIAIRKEDYAYYPDSRIGDAFSYPRGGWPNTDEPKVEAMGAEGSMFMYYCGPIRALARWYRFTGDQQALETATRLVRFVTKRRFWGAVAPPDICAPEHAYFNGTAHMHGHTAMLYALAEYAATTGNWELMNFARDGYEFARAHGITRLGAWLNNQPDVEVGSISDMIATAIKLTEAGVGDYYEDVDQAVRNQLVESQILRADFLREISQVAPRHVAQRPRETSDRVIERTIGILAPMPVGGYKKPYGLGCCTANGTQALYYAWSKIIEPRGEAVQVNLLLNRVSQFMDIDSYLPNEGKVVLRNKSAKRAYVRIPYFVARKSVKVMAQRGRLNVDWLNNYVVLPQIRPNEEIQITFPIREESATYTFRGKPYECIFRGNTAVDISPRVSKPGYRIYLRDNYRREHAPLVTRQLYISPRMIKW